MTPPSEQFGIGDVVFFCNMTRLPLERDILNDMGVYEWIQLRIVAVVRFTGLLRSTFHQGCHVIQSDEQFRNQRNFMYRVRAADSHTELLVAEDFLIRGGPWGRPLRDPTFIRGDMVMMITLTNADVNDLVDMRDFRPWDRYFMDHSRLRYFVHQGRVLGREENVDRSHGFVYRVHSGLNFYTVTIDRLLSIPAYNELRRQHTV